MTARSPRSAAGRRALRLRGPAREGREEAVAARGGSCGLAHAQVRQVTRALRSQRQLFRDGVQSNSKPLPLPLRPASASPDGKANAEHLAASSRLDALCERRRVPGFFNLLLMRCLHRIQIPEALLEKNS
ncbi:uncharacterized protein [Heliangelus exortis]|uniref:uncharacterized protein isoform X3 n=1 Tax=Heliangelus exortis TaxID=472823 RepID=UPI003A915F68